MNMGVIVPLCKNNPGNVGWLDWTPRRAATSELSQSIDPDNPPIDLPSWQYVTATGNVNSKASRTRSTPMIGKIVLFPMFDLTCGDPDFSQVKVAARLRVR